MEILKNYNLKPINFKFGEYISQGFELFKKDFGNFVLAFFFCFLLSIIPFCQFMAIGNFIKYCRKKNRNEACEPSDIFNFDDFLPYFILYAIILGFTLLAIVPFSIMFGFMSVNGEDSSMPVFAGFVTIFFVILMIVLLVITAKAFYMPALISLENIKDLKEAWRISNEMTRGNVIIIILFTFVVSILSQVGVILCFIGIFVTMPFYYICVYVAYEDGLEQISGNAAPSGITKSY